MMIRSENPLPRTHIENESTQIDLRLGVAGSEEIIVRAVVDEGADGELLGVEILNLLDQIGRDALSFWTGVDRPFSYDEEADAFYVRIRNGRSPHQRSIDARLCRDE
jgi:uncharacterized protein YuzE